MKSKGILIALSIITFFILSPCFAQDACDECQQRCYEYGCTGTKLPISPYNKCFDTKSCAVCANHCMFVNCNQPGQVCSGTGCSDPCARPVFFIETCK